MYTKYIYNRYNCECSGFRTMKAEEFRCSVTLTHGFRCGYDYSVYIYIIWTMLKSIEYIFLLQWRQSAAAERDTGLHWRDGTVVFMFLTSTWVLIAGWTFECLRRRKPLIIRYYYWRYNETFEEKLKWKKKNKNKYDNIKHCVPRAVFRGGTKGEKNTVLCDGIYEKQIRGSARVYIPTSV